MKVSVPEVNVGRLVAGLEKLAKRATRLGLEPPTWTVGDEYVKDSGDKNPKTGEAVLRRYCDVEVEGKAPRFEGWRLVAVVANLGEGNVVRTVPGKEVPATYRTAAIACDHCRLARHRKEVFVVAHDDGTTKLVGRTCLKDFLGHKNPEALAAAAEILFAVEALCSDAEGWGAGGRSRVFGLVEFLTTTACLIRTDGWTSRTEARDVCRQATADGVLEVLAPTETLIAKWKLTPELKPAPTVEDEDIATRAAEWAAGLGEDVNDYLWNVRAVARFGYVGEKEAGIAASIVPAFRKVLGDEIKRRAAEKSVFFGTPGKREVFTLTLTDRFDVEGLYGLTRIHRFLTPEGNVAVWFASGGCLGEVGETWKVKATVKKHENRKGVNETVITRCVEVEKVESVS